MCDLVENPEDLFSHNEALIFQTIKEMILKDINKIGRESGLNGFELVCNIFLISLFFLSFRMVKSRQTV